MPNIIEQQICDAIDLLINKRVSTLQFDKTIRATIVSTEDQSIGKYRVRYQDSFFSAYADPAESYRDNTQVYVQIPSNDFNKVKRIVGSVKKLGTEYLNVVSGEDRMSAIGSNVFNFTSIDEIGLCSYKKKHVKTLYKKGATNNFISIDDIDYLRFNEYKKTANHLKVAATIRTALPFEQQELSKGNYGLIIQTNEFSAGQTEANKETYGTDNDTSIIVQRTYALDAQNMTGFIYGFNLPTHQYFYSEQINCKDIIDIESITIFCENFPKEKNIEDEDIFFSDIQLSFAKALTAEQLSGVCLTIETNQSTQGGIIKDDNDDTLKLVAKLQIQGRPVNFSQRSDIQLYWFKKDTSIRFNDPYYLEYGGQGWRCLNSSNFSHQQSNINETIRFVPGSYEYNLLPSEAPAKINTFKCVAVFSDGTKTEGSVQIIRLNGSNITITSSAGTKFKNDKSKTTLKCNISNQDTSSEYKYCWAYRYDNGTLQQVLKEDGSDFKNVKELDISIESSIDVCVYECTVFKKKYNASTKKWFWDYIGAADITLTNGIAEGQYSLIINNGSQVFKYNEYGVSPASRTIAKDNRKQPFSLTFDIYDDQGLVTTPRSDDEEANKEKVKQCNIKWIWPNVNNTLLKLSNASGQGYRIKEDDIIVNPANNEHIARNVVCYKGTDNCNIPQLPILIEDKFNFGKTDNTIRLQVEYEGQHLSASTNFSFIKEGQSGTNGTEYIVRIVPTDENAERVFYERITNGNRNFYKYKKTTSLKREYQKLKNDDDIYGYKDKYRENFSFEKHNTLKAQLFDGSAQGDGLIYDTDKKNSDSDIDINWDILNLGSHGIGKNQKQNISLTKNKNVVLNTQEEFNSDYATIIQAKISSSRLSLNEKAKNYFATYPIDIVSTNNAQYHAIVEDGYRECMFQNDGTRSSYKTIPFKFRLFKGNDLSSASLVNNFDGSKVTWKASWWKNKDRVQTGQEINIDPPEYFNSEDIKNYIDNFITATYKNNGIEVQVLLSIYFYLNRYGLAAMNDWDGTSIKLNTTGDQYILAPQVGAGTKNDKNQFTGITIGKTFNSNRTEKDKEEIGLMGFNEGARSIFLDSKTGNAIFGTSDSSQIVMAPGGWGAAPAGSIYSNNFWDDFYDDGSPKKRKIKDDNHRENRGMLIDLVKPSIEFGNGNFEVNDMGHLTARGGGTISGWEIGDHNLWSTNGKIFLDSETPSIYGQTVQTHPRINGDEGYNNHRHNSLTDTKPGFYLGPDGLSISDTIRITSAGKGKVEIGKITNTKHWTIDGEDNNGNSSIRFNSVALDERQDPYKKANIGEISSVYLGTDGIRLGRKFLVQNDGIVKVGNLQGNHWTINGESDGFNSKSYIAFGTTSFDESSGVYLGTDGIRLGSTFKVTSGGYLTATEGEIAGWHFNGNEFKGGEVYLNKSGSIGGTHWSITAGGVATFSDVRISNNDGDSTLTWGETFAVDKDGNMTALSGNIGGWDLSATGLKFPSANFAVSTEGIQFGSGFEVKTNGSGTIGSCTFSDGVLTAKQLSIGGALLSWNQIDLVTSIGGNYRYSNYSVPTNFSVSTEIIVDAFGASHTVVTGIGYNTVEVHSINSISAKATRRTGINYLGTAGTQEIDSVFSPGESPA